MHTVRKHLYSYIIFLSTKKNSHLRRLGSARIMIAVTQQPRSVTSPYHWKSRREEPQMRTEELESLITVNELLVVYQASHTGNKYRVLNQFTQDLYCADVESQNASLTCSCCAFENCEQDFVFRVKDIKGQELMSVIHPFRLCGECVWCADGCALCPFYVLNNRGVDMGMIRPMKYCCHPVFGIFDTKDTLLYQIRSSQCPVQSPCCAQDIDLPVLRASDDVEVGRITKTRSEVSKGFYDAYNLQMGYVRDTKHRALLLGATFVVDHFIYSENRQF